MALSSFPEWNVWNLTTPISNYRQASAKGFGGLGFGDGLHGKDAGYQSALGVLVMLGQVSSTFK